MTKKSTALVAMAAAGIFSTSACSLSGGNAGNDGAISAGGDFPTDTVSITVPYAAGGPNDIVARAIAPCLGEQLGETVIVENQEGGGGALGTAEVARSAPDGHSLALVPTKGSLLLIPLLQDVGYSLEDFTPVVETYYAPSALYVKADSPYQDAQELFDHAKSEPGSVSIGMAGAATAFDFELRHLAAEYDVPVTAVPFNGGAEAQAALLGENVDGLYALADAGRMAAVEAGDLRVLVTGSPERVDYLPDSPTFAELGYEDLTNSGTSFAIVGPAGLPEDVRTTLSEATQACLTEAEVQKVIGESYVPEEPLTGQGLEDALEVTQAELEMLVKE